MEGKGGWRGWEGKVVRGVEGRGLRKGKAGGAREGLMIYRDCANAVRFGVIADLLKNTGRPVQKRFIRPILRAYFDLLSNKNNKTKKYRLQNPY